MYIDFSLITKMNDRYYSKQQRHWKYNALKLWVKIKSMTFKELIFYGRRHWIDTIQKVPFNTLLR